MSGDADDDGGFAEKMQPEPAKRPQHEETQEAKGRLQMVSTLSTNLGTYLSTFQYYY